MLLKELYEGVQRSKFVLLEDNKESKSLVVLQEFIKQNIKRNKVHLFCFENNIRTFKNCLNYSEKEIQFYDFVSDPKAWIKSAVTETNCQNAINIFNEVKANTLSRDKHPVVIVDSLSSALTLIDLRSLYRQIHQLMSLSVVKDVLVLQVIAVIHTDYLTHRNHALDIFRHLATTIIHIDSDSKSQYTVGTKLKKLNGKIINEVNSLHINSENQLVIEKINCQNPQSTKSVMKDIPETLTTFKLDLGDQEKVARNKLLLPYLKSEEQTGGGGNIYYRPDSYDDWTDEDPDDDLDV